MSAPIDYDYYSDYDDDDDNEGVTNHSRTKNWKCNLCNFLNHPIMQKCEQCELRRGEKPLEMQKRKDTAMIDVFLGDAELNNLLSSYNEDPFKFCEEFMLAVRNGLTISSATRARVFAIFSSHHHHDYLNQLIHLITPSEMLTALKILDAPRKVRNLKRKKTKFQTLNARKSKLKKIQLEIDQLSNELLPEGKSGVTGAFAKKVRRWMGRFPTDKLEFFLMLFPYQPWKEMADLVHCKASDFSLPYFLPCIFGVPPPEDSVVGKIALCQTPIEILPLLTTYPSLTLCYSYIRKKFQPSTLPHELKLELVRLCPLEDVLWFFEELNTQGADVTVQARLDSGESIDAGRGRSSYGKLMDRVLFFQKLGVSFVPQLLDYAENKLRQLCDETKVHSENNQIVVFGDASGSMEVAINTATIIGSLLSVCFNAFLTFFNNDDYPSPIQPKSAQDVFFVTKQIKAHNSTAPAASLYPFYAQKKKVDLFIVVTDEEENTRYKGDNFADLFLKYQTEVNPNVRIFFISFLPPKTNFIGKMHSMLKQKGIFVRQFKFDLQCPDLSRLPHLLGMIIMELCAVEEQRKKFISPFKKQKTQTKLENCETEDFKSVGSHPEIEDIQIVDSHPETEDFKSVNSHPEIEDIQIVNLHPEIEDIQIVNSHPEIEDFQIVDSQLDILNTTNDATNTTTNNNTIESEDVTNLPDMNPFNS